MQPGLENTIKPYALLFLSLIEKRVACLKEETWSARPVTAPALPSALLPSNTRSTNSISEQKDYQIKWKSLPKKDRNLMEGVKENAHHSKWTIGDILWSPTQQESQPKQMCATMPPRLLIDIGIHSFSFSREGLWLLTSWNVAQNEAIKPFKFTPASLFSNPLGLNKRRWELTVPRDGSWSAKCSLRERRAPLTYLPQPESLLLQS